MSSDLAKDDRHILPKDAKGDPQPLARRKRLVRILKFSSISVTGISAIFGAATSHSLNVITWITLGFLTVGLIGSILLQAQENAYAEQQADERMRASLEQEQHLFTQFERLLNPLERITVQVWFDIPLDQPALEGYQPVTEENEIHSGGVREVSLRGRSKQEKTLWTLLEKLTFAVSVYKFQELKDDGASVEGRDYSGHALVGLKVGAFGIKSPPSFSYSRNENKLHAQTAEVELVPNLVRRKFSSMVDFDGATVIVQAQTFVAPRPLKIVCREMTLRSERGMVIISDRLDRCSEEYGRYQGTLRIFWD